MDFDYVRSTPLVRDRLGADECKNNWEMQVAIGQYIRWNNEKHVDGQERGLEDSRQKSEVQLFPEKVEVWSHSLTLDDMQLLLC